MPRPHLDRRATADQRCALLPRVGREQLQRLGELGVGRLEPAGAEQRVGPLLEQLDPFRRVGVVRQQPQRALEVARRRGGRLLEHPAGGVGQQIDRGAIAAPGGVLDVTRALDRAGAVAGERVRGAGVRAQSPRGGSGGVDGVPQQRVTEDETARRRGGADQRGLEQCVERRERRVLIGLCDVGDQLGLERLADYRRGLQRAPRFAGQRVELARQGGRHGGGDARATRPERRARSCVRPRSCELLEIERVAAAQLVERWQHDRHRKGRPPRRG